jgi:hypothetical protein
MGRTGPDSKAIKLGLVESPAARSISVCGAALAPMAKAIKPKPQALRPKMFNCDMFTSINETYLSHEY